MRTVDLRYADVTLFFTTKDRYLRGIEIKPHYAKPTDPMVYITPTAIVRKETAHEISKINLVHKDNQIELPIDKEKTEFVRSFYGRPVPRFLLTEPFELLEEEVLSVLKIPKRMLKKKKTKIKNKFRRKFYETNCIK